MIVQLGQVSKAYLAGTESVVALEGVDLGIARGEFVCVYGASGSGKTTLLNVIAGIDTPDSGQVTVAGHELRGLRESARADLRLAHVGVVFQSNNLLPELSAIDNVVLPLLVQGRSRREARQVALGALDSVGLAASLAERLPGLMSGGQRQRVGIARALAGEREVFLADEPTGALDSENSRSLFGLMRTLCDQRGTTTVLATHDPLAREFADSVYGMVDGVVTAA